MTTFGSKASSILLTSLIYAGLLVPAFTLADDAPSIHAANFFQDVSLTENGELKGRLVNRSGAPLADVEMTLVAGREALTTLTDADGNFAFANLKGTTCIVESGEVQQNCRAWMANTAPPSASNGLLLVADDEQVARGQNRRRRRRRLLLVGGRIGMKAVTIPLMAAGALARKRDRDAEEEEEAAADESESNSEGTDSAAADADADTNAESGDDGNETDASGDTDAGSDPDANAGPATDPSSEADPADLGTDTGSDAGTDTGADIETGTDFDDTDPVDFDDSEFDVDAGDSNSAS